MTYRYFLPNTRRRTEVFNVEDEQHNKVRRAAAAEDEVDVAFDVTVFKVVSSAIDQ